MATFKITLIKRTPFRAEAEEEWSNSYHLNGTEPANAAAWATLAEAIWAMEGAFIYTGNVNTHLVRAYGYSPGSDVATYVGDFTAGGTTVGINPVGGAYTHNGPEQAMLNQCVLLRFQCGLSTKTGRPRYVMKYIHAVPVGYYANETTNGLAAAGATALASMYNGTLPAGVVLCAPDGTECTSGILSPYYTTHQIKRRGKRPRRGA